MKLQQEVGEAVNITAIKGRKTPADDASDIESDDPLVEDQETSVQGTGDAQESEDHAADIARTAPAPRKERTISFSVRSLSLGVFISALVVALGVMTWLYIGADRNVDAQAQQAVDNQHAEQVALDYAVRAAVMDYKDLGPWKHALVDGTTPELGKKLTDAANAMEQILLPLQWSSTAKPIAAKVRSHDNGMYAVDAFVSVMTKTVQAPQDLQSTATYSVTLNPGDGWKISDVGGIGQVVGDK